MGENVTQDFTEANGRLNPAAAAGQVFLLDRFSNKSFHLTVVGAGDYDIELSNDKGLATGSFFPFATGLTAGEHFFFTEHPTAATAFPESVHAMRIVTAVQGVGTIGRFSGHDPR